MPDEQQLNWQKVMEIGADSLAGGVASAIIDQMFAEQNDTQAIVTRAIEEICTRLTKVIDNAFMQEYIADTNSIASRLLAYRETNDLNILDEIFAESSNIVERLRRFDSIESITTLNYISTLHLLSIKALAENKPGYNDTLKRVGAGLAEKTKPTAQRLIDHTLASTNKPYKVYLHLNTYSYGYMIDAFQPDSPKLKFHTCYQDNWVTEDSKEHIKWITSEPILIKKEYVFKDSSLSPYELTEEGKNDIIIQEELRKFNEYAAQSMQTFLDIRLNITNGMKDNILHACNSWSAL